MITTSLTVALLASTIMVQDIAPDVLHPQTEQSGGTMSAAQAAYDVRHYTLKLAVDPANKHIKGVGMMRATILSPISEIEIDLDPRFTIGITTVNGKKVTSRTEGGKLILEVGSELTAGSEVETTVAYEGYPHVAIRPPWDGGFVWAKTSDGKDWIATAVQGNGCDLFWPCKDHVADKADEGADMIITVPKGLTAAMAGVLQAVSFGGKETETFIWKTKKPIAHYHIAINIGPYEVIKDSYTSVNGTLVPIEFYALPESKAKAEKLIKDDFKNQIIKLESHLGPYPWGDEKIGIVETPHLGMEHQTMNAYGNQYRKDDRGYDWLIQHEFAHEWWGNMLTQKRSKDFWLHEGTDTYMQPVYSEDIRGKDAYMEALDTLYSQIKNCHPVVPEGNPTDNELMAGNDIYFKSAWMLHTLRGMVGDDLFWKAMRTVLHGKHDVADIQYPIKPVYMNTEEFIEIFNSVTGRDLTWVFDVYLREAASVIVDEDRSDTSLSLKWNIPGNRPFPMPLDVSINGAVVTLDMTSGSASIAITNEDDIIIDPDHKILMHREGGQTCKTASRNQ